MGFDENNTQLHNIITKWEVTDASVGEIDNYGNFTAYEKVGFYQNVIQAEILQRNSLPKSIGGN